MILGAWSAYLVNQFQRKRLAGAIFEAKPTAAAWHNRPVRYIVSSNDRMIASEQEKSMAQQLKATTTVLPSSHVVMLSHPREVAKVIEEASAGITK